MPQMPQVGCLPPVDVHWFQAQAVRVIMAYCNGGVAATAVLFAPSSIGCKRLTNYDGSWNERGARLDLGVEAQA